MTLVDDGRADFIQGGPWYPLQGPLQRGLAVGERLDLTLNTVSGNPSQGAG